MRTLLAIALLVVIANGLVLCMEEGRGTENGVPLVNLRFIDLRNPRDIHPFKGISAFSGENVGLSATLPIDTELYHQNDIIPSNYLIRNATNRPYILRVPCSGPLHHPVQLWACRKGDAKAVLLEGLAEFSAMDNYLSATFQLGPESSISFPISLNSTLVFSKDRGVILSKLMVTKSISGIPGIRLKENQIQLYPRFILAPFPNSSDPEFLIQLKQPLTFPTASILANDPVMIRYSPTDREDDVFMSMCASIDHHLISKGSLSNNFIADFVKSRIPEGGLASSARLFKQSFIKYLVIKQNLQAKLKADKDPSLDSVVERASRLTEWLEVNLFAQQDIYRSYFLAISMAMSSNRSAPPDFNIGYGFSPSDREILAAIKQVLREK